MFELTLEIYNRIRKNFRNTRWILQKTDDDILSSEQLIQVPLVRRNQYRLHLIEAVSQSNQSQKFLNQFRSTETREDFDEASRLSFLAVASYKQAIRLYSNSSGVWNNLGAQLSCNQAFKEPNSKNYSESLQALWSAVRNNFIYYRAWFNIGVIYECKNDIFTARIFYFIAGIFETFSDLLNLLRTSFRYFYQFGNWVTPYIFDVLRRLLSGSFTLYNFISRNLVFLTSYLHQSFQESRILPRTLQFCSQQCQDAISFFDNSFQYFQELENHTEIEEFIGNVYPIEEDELLPQESVVQYVNRLLIDRNSRSLINYLYNLMDNDVEYLDGLEVNFQNFENLLLNYPENILRTQQQLNAIVGSALGWLVNYAVLDLQFINFQPTRSRDWEILGKELVQQNKFLEGILSFCYAIKISCDRIAAESWYYKGVAHFHREYYEDSITCFNRALELQPNYIAPLEYKGHAHNEIAEYTQAISIFKQFLTYQ